MSESTQELPTWSWWGMLGSALGAQLCCGLPWLLVSFGISGGLISQLEALRPFRPLFIAAAITFFLAGWLTLRRRQRQGCPLPGARRAGKALASASPSGPDGPSN